MNDFDQAFEKYVTEQLEKIKRTGPKPVLEEPYKQCECGSEAAGSSRHAYYCPKFEK